MLVSSTSKNIKILIIHFVYVIEELGVEAMCFYLNMVSLSFIFIRTQNNKYYLKLTHITVRFCDLNFNKDVQPNIYIVSD
jgi:hypothetical protein